MTTQQKRSRQQRALVLVRQRANFWGAQQELPQVEFDGKTVNPLGKYLKACREEDNLNRKGVQ
jgi:hypothetical protein